MQHSWRPVVGYEGLYEVSNFGGVRSLDRTHIVNGRVRKIYGRVLRPALGKKGTKRYTPMVGLYKDGVSKTWTVHRLVALAWVPNPERLPGVKHKDHDRFNNRADNLEWCRKCHRRGFKHKNPRQGEDVPASRLRWEEVRWLREEYADDGWTQEQLAEHLGVSQTTIHRIVRNLTWKDDHYTPRRERWTSPKATTRRTPTT